MSTDNRSTETADPCLHCGGDHPAQVCHLIDDDGPETATPTLREQWVADGTMPDLTFEAWSVDLNKLSVADPHRYGGVDVIEACGPECWRDYYDDGYSPKDAWDEDGTYD